MYGHLIPSSGGRSIPLSKTRLYLGRVRGSDEPLSRNNALCQLELVEGFWHLEDLNTPNGVKVNGRTCKRDRLMPDDEITIGKNRFRITFEAPKYSAVGKLSKSSRRHSSRESGSGSATQIMPQPASPPAGGILGRLIPVGGGQEIRLTKPRITIGRKPPCDVILERRSISAMHCGLELLEGYWQIRDLGSRNGIRVNNVQVQKAWVLPETRISLAEHRFQLNYVGVGDPPADAQYDDFERSSGSDQRSFMEKLGITERDLDRSRIDAENDEPIQKRWDLLDSD